MPATTLQPISVSPVTDLLSLLNEWLGQLESVAPQPVLLRALPTRAELSSQGHDVDLLITPEHTDQLLQRALIATVEGRCHVQIEARRQRKTQLILWNLDASESLTVDLWHQWDQFVTRRQSLSAAALCEYAAPGTNADEMRIGEPGTVPLVSRDRSTLNAAARLLPELELALLVLHVHVKKRGVVSTVNNRRIQRLMQIVTARSGTSATAGELIDGLRRDLCAADAASHSGVVLSRQTARVAQSLIPSRSRLRPSSRNGSDNLKLRRFRGTWFTGLLQRGGRSLLSTRADNHLAFVGSDGSGKTALTQLLSAAHSRQWLSVVARKLYRRSVLYPIVSSVTRRVLGISRSEFDDRLAPLLALRAMLMCWLMLIGMRLSHVFVRRPKQLLLDRSPESMLVVERRTGQPRFSRLSILMERFAPPLRHVLLLVPYSVLSQRKQEVTESAHGVYQQLLFDQIIRQPVISCVLLSNIASPLAALEALEAILDLSPNGAQSHSVTASDLKSHVRETSLAIRPFAGAANSDVSSEKNGDDRFLLPSASSAKKERAA